jgi:hypothetical protein
MLRNHVMAGLTTLALVGVSAFTASAGDGRDSSRYYIVKADNGACYVTVHRSTDALGRYDSHAAAMRALAIKSQC